MPSLRGVVRFSVSVPPSLVRDFDEAWKGLGYDSRSRAAHDAFRSFVSEYKWSARDEVGEVAGAVVLLYYLGKPGLLKEVVEVQHRFGGVVLSTLHVHLGRDKCLEIIAVRGRAKEIRGLIGELMTKKGVKQLKYTTVAL